MRIIPAYAGSTAKRMISHMQSQDHPRVCGEHGHESEDEERYAGSSPRMRGALKGRPADTISFGIIPAYAGSTMCPWL